MTPEMEALVSRVAQTRIGHRAKRAALDILDNPVLCQDFVAEVEGQSSKFSILDQLKAEFYLRRHHNLPLPDDLRILWKRAQRLKGDIDMDKLEDNAAAETAAADTGPKADAKAKKKAAKAKGAGRRPPPPRKTDGPNRYSVTVDLLRRKTGATKEEICEAYEKQFGDGKMTTVTAALSAVRRREKGKVTKTKSEKRGVVYNLT
jgi:hypothetical protein